MVGSQVRLAKQYENLCARIMRPQLSDLLRGVTIAYGDLSHIAAWHAIEAIDRNAIGASALQQLVKGSPVVLPVKVVADALAKLVLVDLPAKPIVEDMLVAGEYRFHPQNHGTLLRAGALGNQARAITLTIGESVIVADKQNVGSSQGLLQLRMAQNRVVRWKSFAEVTQILSVAVPVGGANFAFNGRQGVELSGASPETEAGCGSHSEVRTRKFSDSRRRAFARETIS